LQYSISSKCDLIAASTQALSAEAVFIFVIDRHIDAAVIDVMKRIDFFPDNIPRPLPFRFVSYARIARTDIPQVECLLVHVGAVLRLDQPSLTCWFLAQASSAGPERDLTE
jgi:hypothetical protein